MKGEGITAGGVTFSGKKASMDWAQIHLPQNTYQCIGGMVYAMSLISEAVVHQEDMMKRQVHGEQVKCTFMQLAQVLLHGLHLLPYSVGWMQVCAAGWEG